MLFPKGGRYGGVPLYCIYQDRCPGVALILIISIPGTTSSHSFFHRLRILVLLLRYPWQGWMKPSLRLGSLSLIACCTGASGGGPPSWAGTAGVAMREAAWVERQPVFIQLAQLVFTGFHLRTYVLKRSSYAYDVKYANTSLQHIS